VSPAGTDGGQLGPEEAATLLASLRRVWTRRDPAPADLAERIVFALSLEDLEVELLHLEEDLLVAGARGEERVRTVTFTSQSLSVLISIGADPNGTRLDGWVDGGGGLDVELRSDAGPRRERADADGRFAFDGLTAGFVQLVFQPTEAAALALRSPVVTPAFGV
jgi:hypothetical protein